MLGADINAGGSDMRNQLSLFGPDGQFGEALSRELAEEKWRLDWGVLFAFSASLALWAILFFMLSRII